MIDEDRPVPVAERQRERGQHDPERHHAIPQAGARRARQPGDPRVEDDREDRDQHPAHERHRVRVAGEREQQSDDQRALRTRPLEQAVEREQVERDQDLGGELGVTHRRVGKQHAPQRGEQEADRGAVEAAEHLVGDRDRQGLEGDRGDQHRGHRIETRDPREHRDQRSVEGQVPGDRGARAARRHRIERGANALDAAELVVDVGAEDRPRQGLVVAHQPGLRDRRPEHDDREQRGREPAIERVRRRGHGHGGAAG